MRGGAGRAKQSGGGGEEGEDSQAGSLAPSLPLPFPVERGGKLIKLQPFIQSLIGSESIRLDLGWGEGEHGR